MQRYMEEFGFLFEKNHSFSMYMVHGGSNFGLTAGANSKEAANSYTAHITSYDYDAPINQQGSPNEKFTAFRDLAKKYVEWTIPEPPTPLPVISIPAFKPYKIAALFGNLPAPSATSVKTPLLFESNELQMFNQGMVVYKAAFPEGTYQLKLRVSDFAVVYINDESVTTYSRDESVSHNLDLSCNKIGCKV